MTLTWITMRWFSCSSCHVIQLSLLTMLTIFTKDSLGGLNERRLLDDLFNRRGYNKLERPVVNESEALDVSFGLTLQQIIDVDEKNQILSTNLWLNIMWKDYNLLWNESEYGGVSSVRVPPALIWKPDILMYNSADEDMDSTFPTNVVLSSDGGCLWVPPGLFLSTCTIDITWFPFDDQRCPLKFGSWTYDSGGINLTLSGEGGGDISSFIPNGEWQLIGMPAERTVHQYDCCPTPYIDITFTVHIRRRTLFYGFNLIIPCVLISSMALLTFTLPSESGEKITIGMYFASTMLMCSMSVMFTVLVLNYHHRSPSTHVMPHWVKKVICVWLAGIVRIERPRPAPSDLPTPPPHRLPSPPPFIAHERESDGQSCDKGASGRWTQIRRDSGDGGKGVARGTTAGEGGGCEESVGGGGVGGIGLSRGRGAKQLISGLQNVLYVTSDCRVKACTTNRSLYHQIYEQHEEQQQQPLKLQIQEQQQQQEQQLKQQSLQPQVQRPSPNGILTSVKVEPTNQIARRRMTSPSCRITPAVMTSRHRDSSHSPPRCHDLTARPSHDVTFKRHDVTAMHHDVTPTRHDVRPTRHDVTCRTRCDVVPGRQDVTRLIGVKHDAMKSREKHKSPDACSCCLTMRTIREALFSKTASSTGAGLCRECSAANGNTGKEDAVGEEGWMVGGVWGGLEGGRNTGGCGGLKGGKGGGGLGGGRDVVEGEDLLKELLVEVRYLADKVRGDEKREDECDDWKFAAMIVDRLCLYLFTLFTIISTFAILFSAPHVIVS